jgi:hypothetical protein
VGFGPVPSQRRQVTQQFGIEMRGKLKRRGPQNENSRN